MGNFRQNLAVRTIKYWTYKKWLGEPRWNADFLFERDLRKLGPAHTVVDIGANIGNITKRMAVTGARVFAYEPDPETFEQLVRNTARFPNVTCIRKAVGAESGRFAMYRNERYDLDPIKYSEGTSLVSQKTNVKAEPDFTIETLDIVRLVEELGAIDLMKMDIEGAELAVLNRLLDTGNIRAIRRLYAETHEKQIPSLRADFAALRRRAKDYQDILNLDWK